MTLRVARVLVVLALSAAGMSAVVSPGAADPGPGTFTKITTPSKDTYLRYDDSHPSSNVLTISGKTSPDVTEVDIVCVNTTPDGEQFAHLASSVPVTGGAFSTVGAFNANLLSCRLRALPTNIQDTDYLGSYSGPILFNDALKRNLSGQTAYDFFTVVDESDGVVGVSSAGDCGIEAMISIAAPELRTGPTGSGCMLGLTEGNLTPSGVSTRSGVLVDGHNAFLPTAVHDYLDQSLSLGLTQPALGVKTTVAADHDVTVSETGPLMRCSMDDTYPPTSASCPSLVSTGVQFRRVVTSSHLGLQVFSQDTFSSVDAKAHSLSLDYRGATPIPETGRTGFTFPHHSSTFTASRPDQKITGLGSSAASMFVRSDLYASADDPTVNSFGVTWSKAPSAITFAHDSPNTFAMHYALNVPAKGQAFLGFAESQALATSTVQKLASGALGEMVDVPTISSPANGATIHTAKTTVRGRLTAGANGLPTAVTVNGHTAKITPKSSTTVAYTATFTEAAGRHTITVTVRDSAGNTAKKSIVVHNAARVPAG